MIFGPTEPVARMIADARQEVLAEVLAACARLAEDFDARAVVLERGMTQRHLAQANTLRAKALGARAVAAEVRGMLAKE